ncbi:hypothetical protein PR048_011460 [Dryococelus australis]|uniref:THAP-type domain-containing protein n=1 Tax=Dryococelus australis TaxID=614101 RepID=A0ABQ9HMY5_9NEOP|nr:hypothetical protein PR048_011460 [Dryococelus australis]
MLHMSVCIPFPVDACCSSAVALRSTIHKVQHQVSSEKQSTHPTNAHSVTISHSASSSLSSTVQHKIVSTKIANTASISSPSCHVSATMSAASSVSTSISFPPMNHGNNHHTQHHAHTHSHHHQHQHHLVSSQESLSPPSNQVLVQAGLSMPMILGHNSPSSTRPHGGLSSHSGHHHNMSHNQKTTTSASAVNPPVHHHPSTHTSLMVQPGVPATLSHHSLNMGVTSAGPHLDALRANDSAENWSSNGCLVFEKSCELCKRRDSNDVTVDHWSVSLRAALGAVSGHAIPLPLWCTVFPSGEKSPNRYKAWISKINGRAFAPCKTVKVCSQHFTDDDFESSSMYKSKLLGIKTPKLLKKSAIPTIRLKGERSTKKKAIGEACSGDISYTSAATCQADTLGKPSMAPPQYGKLFCNELKLCWCPSPSLGLNLVWYKLGRVALKLGTKSDVGLATLRTTGVDTDTRLPSVSVAQGSLWFGRCCCNMLE